MVSELRIGRRERLVLTAIIDMYIATGEPVASQAVARMYANYDGMSSATIRNVMVALGEAGFLEQSHTSAGRTPTAKAFRVYVEQLSGKPHALPAPISTELREQIDDCFTGVTSREQFLERTSHVLALVSSGVGLAAIVRGEAGQLEHIHFTLLAPRRVLAVMVTKSGSVLDRVLQMERDLGAAELEAAAAFLNQNYRGWMFERIRTEVARRIEQDRSEYDKLMRSIEDLYKQGALDRQPAAEMLVYVEGVANLIDGRVDRDRLRQLLAALEEKQRLVDLLTAYVDARQQAVRVVVGLEETMPEMQDLVLIGTGARLGANSLGTVAVLAHTRIHYQETINTVSYIAQLSDRILHSEH
jgi:heat-inducible transcriptional repressor